MEQPLGTIYGRAVPETFDSIEFDHYGPIQNATLKLTRLHALIGPNDSGKSMALRGISDASRLSLLKPPSGPLKGSLAAKAGTLFTSYNASLDSWQARDGDTVIAGGPKHDRRWPWATMLRLDPDALRAVTELVDDAQPLRFLDPRGSGLGSILDAIISRDSSRYAAIEQQLREFFPTVRGLRLFTHGGRRTVGVRLIDGTDVAPESMSEGMLYFLAFAVVPDLENKGLLLIEEPENGLHPARIREVMQMLRKLSATTQVVLTTHSPLVVNELQPDEVTLVTRDPQTGTKFTPISQTPNFERRFKTYALGELWLSYADGVMESPLINPKPSAA